MHPELVANVVLSEHLRQIPGRVVPGLILKRTAGSLQYDQILEKAKKDFTDELAKGLFTEEDLEQFVRDKVQIVTRNGVDITVISANHDTSGSFVDPIVEAYIRNDRTKAIVDEYVLPDIVPKLQNRIIKYITNLVYKDLESDSRFYFNRSVLHIARKAHKPVYATDIANKPLYMIYRDGTGLLTTGVTGNHYIFTLLALMFPQQFDGIAHPLVQFHAVNFIITFIMQGFGAGAFDPNSIHWYEAVLTHLEDARRIFTTEGVEHIASEIETTQTGETNNQLVVLEPQAHAIRIVDHLTRKNTLVRFLVWIKRTLYRFTPFLDFSVRKYEWSDS